MAENISTETHWEQAAKTRMGKYLTQIETHFIQNSINLSQTKTINDVGAEAGRFSQFSKTNTTETISLDIDKYGLKRLKHKAKNTNVIQADARKTPIKNEVFEAIFMIEVLDYIPELRQALAECHRTLKPNASLILSFGNKSSLKAKLRELSGKSYQHKYHEVIQTLTETGFQVKKKTGYNWLLSGRMSENRLIPVLAMMERVFGFRKIPSLSPWVIVHAVKSD
ncbi:MAG TPA: class I SAM-dependent methyltransferase [Candidatus Bathyarchaeia archaeon]|nr:class I SAM-dependent methyltransferase [Candidatus Bathyarchaeia archaeon]